MYYLLKSGETSGIVYVPLMCFWLWVSIPSPDAFTRVALTMNQSYLRKLKKLSCECYSSECLLNGGLDA